MRFSEAWLREWVDPPIDSQTLADQLSMAGLEVDAVEPAAPPFSDVVVGLVEAIEAHPDADKLRVCRVDAGQGEPLQIICGAANVAEGMMVPVAVVGAKLPGDFEIKKAKLRGVESFGMICSAAELGLADSSDGILPLPANAPIGQDFRAYLGLEDTCFEVDLTPDRGDCLSVAGISREIAVINRSSLQPPIIEPVPPAHDARFPVQLLDAAACPRYVCRIIRGINPGAETPLWMQERLRRGGLRSISPVVDVTNYVLLELGQPMHGFDLAKLAGEIRVRPAEAGERLTLLNGEETELRADTLVIADAERPVAMAGIMGGLDSGVTTATRDILLESAFFAPTAIIGKSRGYGLHTDSSHRFERGVDPQLQVAATERATRLLVDIVGGEPGPVHEVAAPDHLPRLESLRLRRRRVTQVLGVEITDEMVEDILGRLGMTLQTDGDGWLVWPPSSRFDLVDEVDVIADIGRIYGYNQIPTSHARSASTTKASPEARFDLARAKLALVDRGYNEVITYSFVNPEIQRLVDPGRDLLTLANPISTDMSAMRTSLWPGLLQAAAYNQARQQERVRIFEAGLRFLKDGEDLRQDEVIGGLIVGGVLPEQWGVAPTPADFFDLKADLEAVLGLSGDVSLFSFSSGDHPALHPGQSARIECNGKLVGHAGMLHPALSSKLDLTGNVFLFEFAVDALTTGVLPAFSPLSKFPAIRRDLAIVVDEAVSFEQIRRCVAEAEPDLLRNLMLFDVYQGENVDSGRKSVALGLILQASSQTLIDEQVEASIARVLERLAAEHGARLRD